MIIPSTVNEFGNNVFESCNTLKEITFEGSTCGIGNEVFKGCSLLETVILGKVRSIGERVFQNLDKITI